MSWEITSGAPGQFEAQAYSDVDGTPIGTPIVYNQNEVAIFVRGDFLDIRRTVVSDPIVLSIGIDKITGPVFSSNKELYDKLKAICFS